jgi:hypothetical protein
MIANLAIEPVTAGSASLSEYRHRPSMGERTILPDSTQQSPAGARPGDRNQQRPADRQQQAANSEPETLRSGASNFAAAVLAGALPPTPQSVDELFRRIGAAEIPQEAEARLKDLMA